MADCMKWMALAAALVAVVSARPMETGRELQKRDQFSDMDYNNDGVLTASDLRVKGISWSQVKVYDLNYDNKLSRDEFNILVQVATNGVKETNYLNHFRRADTSHDALITAAELRKRYKSLGYDYPLSTFTSNIRKKDKNGDGKLDYQEFRAMMRG